MKQKIFLISAIIIIIITNSCKDNGTQPPPIKSVRDYTWIADTLAYEGSAQTLMRSIWGSSASDIYICGHNDNNRGQIYHFDGTRWNSVDIFNAIQIGPISLNEVNGISNNNLWVVGSRLKTNPNPPPNFLNESFIIQYLGSSWIEHKINTHSAVYSVYANSTTDVWACGGDGIVYHYNGYEWETDTVITPFKGSNFQLNNLVVYKGKTYILGNAQDLIRFQDVYYFFSGSMNNWVLVDSMRLDVNNTTFRWGVGKLYNSPWGKLYSSGWGIFEWNGNGWNKIIPYFDNQKPIRAIAGTNENNLILVGDFGKVYHWNGSDLFLFSYLEDNNDPLLYTGIWMNDSEVFLLGHTTSSFPQKTVIWLGK